MSHLNFNLQFPYHVTFDTPKASQWCWCFDFSLSFVTFASRSSKFWTYGNVNAKVSKVIPFRNLMLNITVEDSPIITHSCGSQPWDHCICIHWFQLLVENKKNVIFRFQKFVFQGQFSIIHTAMFMELCSVPYTHRNRLVSCKMCVCVWFSTLVDNQIGVEGKLKSSWKQNLFQNKTNTKYKEKVLKSHQDLMKFC